MIITCCGLIGAGKSTLTNKLSTINNYTLFEELVNCNPFLESYYDDPKRWSFTLQTYYLWERYKQAQESFMRSLRGETVIIDSSIYSDMAFAMVQKELGYFTDSEYETYLNMHKILATQLAYPDVILWLELQPDKTIERIKKRSRDCESGISVEYLTLLYNAYHELFNKLSKHVDIISINAEQSIEGVYNEANSIINKHRKNTNELIYN